MEWLLFAIFHSGEFLVRSRGIATMSFLLFFFFLHHAGFSMGDEV